MNFVNESTIENVITQLEDEKYFMEQLSFLDKNHPILLSFIGNDRLELLTDEEIYFLEFMTLVIYLSCKEELKKDIRIDGKTLEKNEENNWELWNENIKKSVKNAFDIYFQNYPQEDLLAFVEDVLQNDEDQNITSVGMEIIAVTSKSIIDTLHELN
jgi:hypothetical protein